MMPEEFYLQSILQTSDNWIAAVYVAGMFLVAAFRPQQIMKPIHFRVSYVLFALYFMIPTLIPLLLEIMSLDFSSPFEALFYQFNIVTSKVLLGLSIVFALASLIDPHASTRSPANPTDDRTSGISDES